jgi:hypothetical protein
MGRNRKYPTVSGYWVYIIYIPSIAKYYIGVSKQKCHERWKKRYYKSSSLSPYLNEWQSMIKTVIQDGLTKEQAVQLEDELIVKYRNENRCINEVRSGWIRKKDINAYARELYQNNTEYRERQRQQCKQYHENNKEQIQEQQKQYYENNKEKILERQKQRRLKKKLQQQQNQLTLFDEAS